jgi:ParB-like chromosome segregation protein Spo0J
MSLDQGDGGVGAEAEEMAPLADVAAGEDGNPGRRAPDTAGDDGEPEMNADAGQVAPACQIVMDSRLIAAPSAGNDAEPPALAPSPHMHPAGRDSGDNFVSPVRVVPIGELQAGRYGQKLGAMFPGDAKTLENSIREHGVRNPIHADEKLVVLDGNLRREACQTLGIDPPVLVVRGLTELEKEEYAVSANLDRRQMTDTDAWTKAREHQLNIFLEWRQDNPRRWTHDRIAGLVGCARSTVAAYEKAGHNAGAGNASKPDARQRYDAEQKRAAVELVLRGQMDVKHAAREQLMSERAVRRALQDHRESQRVNSDRSNHKPQSTANKKTESPPPVHTNPPNDSGASLGFGAPVTTGPVTIEPKGTRPTRAAHTAVPDLVNRVYGQLGVADGVDREKRYLDDLTRARNEARDLVEDALQETTGNETEAMVYLHELLLLHEAAVDTARRRLEERLRRPFTSLMHESAG